jgi:hypothetical protein
MLTESGSALFQLLQNINKNAIQDSDTTSNDIRYNVEHICKHLNKMHTILKDVESTAPSSLGSKENSLNVDLRAVYTSIEFVWKVTLYPNVLKAYSHINENNMKHPKTLVITDDSMQKLLRNARELYFDDNEIWVALQLVVNIVMLPIFAHTMQKRFIKRLLLFLLYIISKKSDASEFYNLVMFLHY